MGLTMILPFDRIVVAEGAKLSIRFVKLGLVPELASTMYLPLRCGWGAASDLMLSGRTVLGDEAVALGLADELASVDDVVDVAIARARSYAENPPQALRWIKELLSQNASETDAGGGAETGDQPGGSGLPDTRARRGGRRLPRRAIAPVPLSAEPVLKRGPGRAAAWPRPSRSGSEAAARGAPAPAVPGRGGRAGTRRA